MLKTMTYGSRGAPPGASRSLEQGRGVRNRDADAPGEDGQRIMDERGNACTVIAGDVPLQFTQKHGN